VNIGQLSEQAKRKGQLAHFTMQENNTVQVLSRIHAEMGWKYVMNEPQLH